MGLETPGIVTFINEFETTDPDVFIIEIEFLLSIHWMADITMALR
jgi:hypothetical protein